MLTEADSDLACLIPRLSCGHWDSSPVVSALSPSRQSRLRYLVIFIMCLVYKGGGGCTTGCRGLNYFKTSVVSPQQTPGETRYVCIKPTQRFIHDSVTLTFSADCNWPLRWVSQNVVSQ